MKKYLALFIILLLFACGGKKEKVNQEFSKKGTIELMKEIEKDRYTSPEHGRLTEDQIEMYLDVKNEEIVYAKQAAENFKAKAENLDEIEKNEKRPRLRDYKTAFKALGDVADLFTADLRAAKKLGYNTKEYQWIKETIIETDLSVMQDSIYAPTIGLYNNMLQTLKEQRNAATSEEGRSLIDEQIKDMTETLKEMEDDQPENDEAMEYNKKLLLKYEDRIVGLEAELNKWQLLEESDDDEVDEDEVE